MTFEKLDENFVRNIIDTPVDYTQWQRNVRKTKTKSTKAASKDESARTLKKVNYSQSPSIPEKRSVVYHKEERRLDFPTYSSPPSYTSTHVKRRSSTSDAVGSPFAELRKECSSRCRHGVTVKPQEVEKTEQKKSKDSVISLLKIQIKEKQVSLRESKQRYLQLIRDNIRLKDEITSYEEEKHQDVKQLLERYGKYRGGFSVLATQHSQDVKKQERNLREVWERCATSIKVLEEEVQKLDLLIEDEKHSLKVLLNYKEKEYPEKVEQIRHLKKELACLEADFEENLSQLTEIATIEKQSFQGLATGRIHNVISVYAQNAIDDLDVSVKEMAQQNLTMKKEINTHMEEEEKHQKEIYLLRQEIKRLKKMEERRLACRKHPELFAEKCFPDTEFVLSIPMQGSVPF